MSKSVKAVGGIAAALAILTLYLFLWPVPVDPVSWDAPQDLGLVDPFEANDRLRRARLIDLGTHAGPEDVAGGPDGKIYTGTSDGNIIRFASNGSGVEIFARAGGRPLGLEFDRDGNLYVANAYLGLQKIAPDGQVTLLTDSVDGAPINYTDDVAVARDGSIYFSDASAKFGVREIGDTYQASLLDIMEHGGHGSVLKYDPATDETSVVIDGLNFANGVAISDDQRFLLINETGTYRVLRFWLDGDRAGETDVVIDNLPGFPDNINNGRSGKFWIGLVAPRIRLLDNMSDMPWLRRLVQRLPSAVRPQAVPSSHVIAISGDGEVLMNLQDSAATLPGLTGVYESRDALWLSSLFGTSTALLDKRELAVR